MTFFRFLYFKNIKLVIYAKFYFNRILIYYWRRSKEPKTTEYGLSILLETKRIHMEKTVNKAHEIIIIVRELLFKEFETSCLVKDFVSELLLVKCYENKNIENVIQIFKLNESNEPCVKLELALAKKSSG